ncbi:MAG TPA: lipoprotein, partial [Longimicrobium sp.]|nr:lipoprotein [Longimicrobium sp.]
MRRFVWTLGALAVLAGCAAAGGSSRARGPFLRPGPLGPDNGGVPRAPDRWAGAAEPGGAAATPARLPAGLRSGDGRKPLPGARLAGIGAYRAVVVPLALGTAMPRLDEQVLSSGYFGAPGVAGTLGDALFRESGGAFRMTAQVLPV